MDRSLLPWDSHRTIASAVICRSSGLALQAYFVGAPLTNISVNEVGEERRSTKERSILIRVIRG